MCSGATRERLSAGEPNVHLSPTQAAAIARTGRRLLQAGSITHHQLALLDALLWRCRKHGQAAACASYSGLQRLCHMARDTVWTGLQRLEQLGLIRKVKQRIRIGWVSRQATSIYVFSTESGERTVYKEIPEKVVEKPASAVTEAQRALARVRTAMEARMLGKGRRANIVDCWRR
jgi:hypothetical protein